MTKSNSNELPISVPLSIFYLYQENELKRQKMNLIACTIKAN